MTILKQGNSLALFRQQQKPLSESQVENLYRKMLWVTPQSSMSCYRRSDRRRNRENGFDMKVERIWEKEKKLLEIVLSKTMEKEDSFAREGIVGTNRNSALIKKRLIRHLKYETKLDELKKFYEQDANIRIKQGYSNLYGQFEPMPGYKIYDAFYSLNNGIVPISVNVFLALRKKILAEGPKKSLREGLLEPSFDYLPTLTNMLVVYAPPNVTFAQEMKLCDEQTAREREKYLGTYGSGRSIDLRAGREKGYFRSIGKDGGHVDFRIPDSLPDENGNMIKNVWEQANRMIVVLLGFVGGKPTIESKLEPAKGTFNWGYYLTLHPDAAQAICIPSPLHGKGILENRSFDLTGKMHWESAFPENPNAFNVHMWLSGDEVQNQWNWGGTRVDIGAIKAGAGWNSITFNSDVFQNEYGMLAFPQQILENTLNSK